MAVDLHVVRRVREDGAGAIRTHQGGVAAGARASPQISRCRPRCRCHLAG